MITQRDAEEKLFTISANGVSVCCHTSESLIGWIQYFLERRGSPSIVISTLATGDDL